VIQGEALEKRLTREQELAEKLLRPYIKERGGTDNTEVFSGGNTEYIKPGT
jgi:hypothetical protein